jgi:hypothetical protein
MSSEPEDLFQYVERTFPGHEVHLVYEVDCCGFSVARHFFNLGWRVGSIISAAIDGEKCALKIVESLKLYTT